MKPEVSSRAREMIGSSSFSEPAFEALADAWVTFSKLLEANGSHPEMGKELPRRFLEAGFSVIHGSASFEYFGTPEDVAFYHGFSVSLVLRAKSRPGRHQVRAGNPGEVRQLAPPAGPMEGFPGRRLRHAWGRAVGQKP